MLAFDAMNCSRLDAPYLGELRAGGIDALHTSLVWGENPDLRTTLQTLARFHERVSALREHVVLACATEDIARAKADGRIAVVLGLQNTTPIGDEALFLDLLGRLGVRVVQLTYNHRNLVGDGCMERRDAGLSAFGTTVVRRLNALGIAVDVSHASEQTFLDAVAVSSAPAICSHANSRTLCDTPRNLTDRQVEALAAKGGVVGVTSIGHFVSDTAPSLDRMLDHVDHFVSLVGHDYVGIGTDLFERRHLDVYAAASTLADAYRLPADSVRITAVVRSRSGDAEYDRSAPDPSWARRAVGLQRAVDFPNVADGLRRRGYRDQHVEQILGGNFLRVLREIWGR